MNFNSQETRYIRIKQILTLFYQLTKTHLTFIDASLHLVTSDGLLIDPDKVNAFFHKKNLSFFFPLITNGQFNGLFITNKNSIPVNTTSLHQDALENIATSVLNAYYQEITILSPLTKEELTKGSQLFSLLISGAVNEVESVTHTFKPAPTPSNNKGRNDIDIALSYIDQNIDQKLTLVTVAKNSYLSPAYLSRLFKEHFKINFSNYIRIRKIALAQTQLISTDQPINDVSKTIGFARANYFNKVFKETTSLTPLQFRKRYSGAQKIYTINRDLAWNDNISVYAASQHYFQKKGIVLREKNINGRPCIVAIDGLSSLNNTKGWIYLVDGVQPQIFPSETYVKDKSVIQWIYVTLS
ncbi:helix-turn-helix domain-containing protein [Levilactobacillus fujinensis]|uniref:Helix-turn-helix domain-containing protein n=1 Tax=Levilactobacillus fujinensis TaxID=2486024 RepID=A0ABW1TD65_9LACO|nr:helix-turn-helix domain-containing protein [Levilactobacillus fujinensis]